jgi:hypothetical protein
MSLKSKVLGFFGKVKAVASAVMIAVFGQKAATEFAEKALVLMQEEAGVIVRGVVAALENSSLSNAEKFQTAVRNSSNELLVAKKALPEALIGLLVQLAVNELRGHFTAA